ncbi:hypothetical protein E4K67_10560 [Desulfosporosinus fructosivorans]|uniref:Uncharacterized protein n=1 Tax=Desulfosporosinus fructosivorans TaxID=2018669 RepID=A0A4Z0R753_9FIRM|nr:hypothetical protein [Desulfosporosinus fructosivorans]TGE38384.1 hypothetical protein E4K67_10560 [Desulfosporosinus fructosivorans]
MEDLKCWHYEPIDPDEKKVNNPNCTHRGWTRCKDEKPLMDRFKETRTSYGMMGLAVESDRYVGVN